MTVGLGYFSIYNTNCTETSGAINTQTKRINVNETLHNRLRTLGLVSRLVSE